MYSVGLYYESFFRNACRKRVKMGLEVFKEKTRTFHTLIVIIIIMNVQWINLSVLYCCFNVFESASDYPSDIFKDLGAWRSKRNSINLGDYIKCFLFAIHKEGQRLRNDSFILFKYSCKKL